MKKDIVSICQNSSNEESAISRIEKEYGIVFSKALKDFYLLYGNKPISPVPFYVDGYEFSISKVVPIIAEGLTFEKIVKNDRIDGFIPTSYYPIAQDRGGNVVYWDAETGKVYYLLSDDIENHCLVSNSVDEFMETVISSQ